MHSGGVRGQEDRKSRKIERQGRGDGMDARMPACPGWVKWDEMSSVDAQTMSEGKTRAQHHVEQNA